MLNDELILAGTAAVILGFGKAGFKGIGPIVALLLAAAFGARNAAGMFVPLMLVGDLIAIYHYRASIQKRYLWQFLPWVLLGLFTAAAVGKDIPEAIFKPILASLICLSLFLLLLKKRPWIQRQLKRKWFASMMGMGAGFSSMIGNFAGAFGSIFFLSTGIPKKEIIGTTTLVFFIGNLCKLPIHFFIF
ncbi:MAG: TSUP family transporter, partial [Saprospiraceae bacterium]